MTQRRFRTGRVRAWGLALTLALLVSGCADHGSSHATGTSSGNGSASAKVSPPQSENLPQNVPGVIAHLPARGLFGDRSVWGKNVSHAPLNPRSRAMVRNLAAQVADHWGGTAAFNYDQYNTSFYSVPADQPRVTVGFDNCQQKPDVPTGVYTGQAAFSDVPFPADAVPSTGTDGSIALYSRSADQLWEFWKVAKVNGQWQACWGGRIDHVSTSPGFFNDGMGSTATGLAASGGTISVREMRRGHIRHAMALAVITAADYRTLSWPAQRSDGDGPVGARDQIPEGIRFRLDPRINVNKLHLSRVGKIIARAAQRYGFIVTDKSGAVALIAERGYSPAANQRSPWPSIFRGVPDYLQLKGFPWRHLQALPANYGKP